MFLAGLYNQCAPLDDPLDVTCCFTVVTEEANSEMEWLKGRHPVILTTEAGVGATTSSEPRAPPSTRR